MSAYRPARITTEHVEKFIDRINEVPEFAKAPIISVTPKWADYGFPTEKAYRDYLYSFPVDESICEFCGKTVYHRQSDQKFNHEKQRPLTLIDKHSYPIQYAFDSRSDDGTYSLHWCCDQDITLEKKVESLAAMAKQQAEVHKKLMEKIIFLESCTEKRKFYVEDALY